ncbi:LacI family DNA-binding transcriptional regulator [Rhabdobacter roseus]|uniref:LacI family transcriptional regulator/LacI family repressor for deo operon, udp, cdd, tsx, nupC, and nupG n=1 Tax=Rhabdobacter roseus TaxID=1655419 RepID=A0A840TWU6_9BACT|nr:substrate-binding domain-containing protein [Rhabdobacter roseus]MBB5286072.1 LacI family transcriptional regulator/LacI family repressor for deo operon, udp, cdd, tsx, nupC, and nupG [Rhabdobacter roseus]
MIECSKCQRVESIMKAGFVRGKQRYLCKDCNYFFTLPSAQVPTKRKRHQTTIIDIARELGVSNSTVSRALHGHPDISPDTKKAILEAAIQLDYQPNQLAYSLVKSRSNTVGIIVPEFLTQFFPNVIVGAQGVLSRAGYHLMIMQSDESYETEVGNTRALLANRVDGLIVSMSHETNNYEHFQAFEKRGVPVVYFNRVCREIGTYKVVVNDYQGAFRAVEHLIANGYRRIAHLAGPRNLVISQERLRGYTEALQKYGLPVLPELTIHGDLTVEKARIYGRYLLELDHPPDAIFAVNDPTAIEILLLARAKGLRVPEQLGVVGFSDDSIAMHIGNGLTTVKQPTNLMGQTAAELILKLISEDEDTYPAETQVLETELIIRGSSVRGGR